VLTSTGPTSEALDEPLATTEVAADESQPVLDLDVVAISPRMALGTRATMQAVEPIDFGGALQATGQTILTTSDDAVADVVAIAETDVDKMPHDGIGGALGEDLVDILAIV
jgi:hypothetical protein